MAQTGYTPILIYSSSTGGNLPLAASLTNSTLGSELAINITDGKLFYKDNANAVQVIGWKVVPATAGGTGQTVYAVGDILYASSTTALSKLADVATGNALISGGVGVAPSWGKVGLTTHVSGTLPIANGGTNQTAFTGKSGNICGLVFYDGTSFQNDSTVSHVGYDTVANTFYANNVNFGGTVTLASALPTTQGGTGLTSFTANGIVYASSTSALATSGNFKYDGTNFSMNVTAYAAVSKINLGDGTDNSTTVKTTDILVTPDDNTWKGSGAGMRVNRTWLNVSYLDFLVSNGGARFVAERIHASGGVSIGNTTDPGANNLSVTGNVTATGMYPGVLSISGQTIATTSSNNNINLTPNGTGYIYSSGALLQGYGWFAYNKSIVAASYLEIISDSAGGSLPILMRSGGGGGVTLAAGGTSWGAYSDERLKNITGTYVNPIDDLMQIKPIKFTWKKDEAQTPCVGVIAQSVQKVVPEAISVGTYEKDDPTEYLTVRYTELIPLMIASIQSQQKTIEELQTQIKLLGAK